GIKTSLPFSIQPKAIIETKIDQLFWSKLRTQKVDDAYVAKQHITTFQKTMKKNGSAKHANIKNEYLVIR
ncbi:hypothetical protein, partial [Acinetobacter baumannii]|uniref:hypothetical protein n=1 Tax=Acinetobacter baumannii TaxID=470 RepID=UPI0033216B54